MKLLKVEPYNKLEERNLDAFIQAETKKVQDSNYCLMVSLDYFLKAKQELKIMNFKKADLYIEYAKDYKRRSGSKDKSYLKVFKIHKAKMLKINKDSKGVF